MIVSCRHIASSNRVNRGEKFKSDMAQLKKDIITAKESKEQLDDENKLLRAALTAKKTGKAMLQNKQVMTDMAREESIKRKKPSHTEDELNTLRREQKKYLADLSNALDGLKHKDRRIRILV